MLFALPVFADVFDHPLTDKSAAEELITAPEKISGDFRQEKLMSTLGVTLKSNGKFIINKESGILWQNISPLNNTTIIQRHKICTYTAKQQLTSLDTSGNEALKSILNVINSIFIQDYTEMAKYFDLYFMPVEGGYELGLVAKDKMLASVIERMHVYGGSYIERIEFSDVNKDYTTIYFSEISEDAENFSCPE